MADLVGEANEVNGKDMALALRAVEELARVGFERASRAHSLMVWELAAQVSSS